jgi:TIR domain
MSVRTHSSSACRACTDPSSQPSPGLGRVLAVGAARSGGRGRVLWLAAYDSLAVASTSDIWQPFFLGGRTFRLFISHTSAHKGEVGLLSSALSAHGIAGFVAHTSINPTEAWQDVIVRALGECEALAAYLTADFPQSRWTDQEVGAAVVRDLLVLPLRRRWA